MTKDSLCVFSWFQHYKAEFAQIVAGHVYVINTSPRWDAA